MMRPDAKVEKVYLYPKPVDFAASILIIEAGFFELHKYSYMYGGSPSCLFFYEAGWLCFA